MGIIAAIENRRERKPQALPARLFFSGSNPPHRKEDIGDVANRPDAEFIEFVKGLKATPEGVFQNPDLLEYFLPILRSDFSLISKDSPTPLERPLRPRASIFYGTLDQITTESVYEWTKCFSSPPTVHPIDGDHFFICEGRTVQAVLDKIIEDISTP